MAYQRSKVLHFILMEEHTESYMLYLCKICSLKSLLHGWYYVRYVVCHSWRSGHRVTLEGYFVYVVRNRVVDTYNGRVVRMM